MKGDDRIHGSASGGLRPPRWIWTQALVLVLAAIAIGQLLWTNHASGRRVVQALEAVDAIRQLQLASSLSHLWLMESITGDRQSDASVVWHELDRALALLQQVLEGGSTVGDARILEPLTDPGLRREAEILLAQLRTLRDLAIQRYRDGAGNEVDVAFDQTFRELLKGSDELCANLERRAQRFEELSEVRLAAAIVVWIAAVLGALIVMWLQERGRRAAVAALSQRQSELHHASRMEAVGRLAGGVAHEINNYLGAISGYCEMLRIKVAGNEDLERRVDAAMETADDAAGLVRRLLAFGRRQASRPRHVDLGRLATAMEAMTRHLVGDDITLTFRREENLWSVVIDPNQVEQMIVHLLFNSRDAMPKGGEIVIETRNLELDAAVGGKGEPGRYVALSVADHGIGIAPDAMAKVFDPFFSAGGKENARGLGLAAVHGIAVQNGGFVTVESELGRGTTVTVHLPATDRPARSPQRSQEVAPADAGARILLVEDNEPMRDSWHRVLQAMGHDVLQAANGEEALELLDEDSSPLDLVITDVVMPGLSGPELVERIRERRGEVRCLFVSGYSDDDTLHRGLDQTRDAFLEKPYNAARLSRKIAEILAEHE